VATLLSGIRVLDLTTVLAGPFAAYQLSLMGADVIKIEIPGTGDLARDFGEREDLKAVSMGPSFLAQNSGKRSLTVNLKIDEGRRVFTRLLESADVLIENMRPGVLERLGFSWEAIHEINPALVYCAVSGFGQTGPLADRTAYDQIIQGFAGIAAVTGERSGGPLRVGFPVCDTLGGYAAAMAIGAALVRRLRDGVGSFLDVSMLETALTAMSWVVSEQLISGRPAQRHGNDNAASSPSGSFRASDGLINIATNTQTQFEALCRVCDRLDLVADTRFATRSDRKRHRAALSEELDRALGTRPAAEWEVLLAEVSVPAGRILNLDEALDQEQIRVRELIHEVEVPVSGGVTVKVLGSGVHVDGAALSPSLPPPTLGQHTQSILTELGYSPQEIDALRESAAV
jgi:crotonobetainyl-CoA:carnitine CoA-transferase CaiB-like acyl-CoA transferase